MKNRKLEIYNAMNMFCNSTVFEKLHNKETGLYLENSLYVYDLLQNELHNRRLIQEEQ
jgi:hypothetical protein